MGEPKRKPTDRAGETGGSPSFRPDISEKLLAYFRRNASAMDSVEGIARFWVQENRNIVEASLESLRENGFLERCEIAGTVFYSLRRETAAPAVPSPPRAMVAAGATRASATPARILVVDDDEPVRKFLVAALEEAGHTVEAAINGDDALQKFRARPFDLVVTDIMMPGVSGLEVLRAVKQTSPWTEVIVVTAHASLDTALRALRDGAYDLVTKPIPDLESLDRVVTRALEKHRLQAENRLLVDALQARNLELTETVARLAAVNEIGRATTGLLNMEELYDTLVRLVARHLKARRVSVFICEPESDSMTLVASVGIEDPGAKDRTVRIGEGIAGRVAASDAPLLVEDIEKSDLRALRTGGRYATASFMITPLTVSYPIRYQRRRVGVINVSDKHSGQPFNEHDLEFLSTLSSQVAVAIENARLVREMENGYLGALESFIRAAEESRPETRGHSLRVGEVAGAIGEAMGLERPRLDLLMRAAALHEVGRLTGRAAQGGRPADFWNTAAALAAERNLAPIASLKSVREIILRSADWFDAVPAPFGADSPSLPIEARILSVTEEFVRLAPAGADAASARHAADALRREAGRKHDPKVVAVLIRLVGEGAVL